MSAKSTTGREAGSAARKSRALERLLVVAAVAAVLVSVGAWIAMNRPGAGAEAAGAESSVAASGGTSAESAGTAGSTGAAGETAEASTGDAGTGDADTGDAEATNAPPSSAAASSSTPVGQAGTAAKPTGSATAPLSPTTAFLTALTESGLAPPIDDAQKLAMADDVCQELGYGSTYADVVRALTFAGASDAEAANFSELAITHLCSQYEID